MKDKSILDKIKKLFNLSTSSNQNESALALEKAIALMEKHGISDYELKLCDVTEVESLQMKVGRLCDYQSYLLSSIADLFGCQVYYTYVRSNTSKWVVRPVFIGLDPSAAIASYCFEVMFLKQEKARQEYIASLHKNTKKRNKTIRGNEFAIGWAIGIDSTVKKLVPCPLVPDIVTRYYSEKTESYGGSTYRKSKKSKDDKALLEGQEAGKKVDINKPLSGSKSTLCLV